MASILKQPFANSLSRRTVLATGAGLAAGLLGGSEASAQGKIAQAAANYQNGPNNGQSCSGCTHFLPPSSCEIVDGAISPQGWCKFYTARGR